MHRAERLPDLRALMGRGSDAGHQRKAGDGRSISTTTVSRAVQPVETPNQRPRPDGACLTHRPPKEGFPWRRADHGYQTCSSCYDILHRWLSPLSIDTDGMPASIIGLYATLNPVLGSNGTGRRAPGFGSRSPASDHIIVMRDKRSVRVEHNDPHSVPGLLSSWCQLVAEERDVKPPVHAVPELARFLDSHLDWISRAHWVDELFTELRGLVAQLKAVGQPRRRIGLCPTTIDQGQHTQLCEAVLLAPLAGDSIRCWSCGREWPRPEWERLGQLLQEEIQRDSA